MPIIEVKNVVGGYGGVPILNGVNISIEQSDIVEEVATPAKKTARKRKAAAPKPKAAKANTSSRRTRRAAQCGSRHVGGGRGHRDQ